MSLSSLQLDAFFTVAKVKSFSKAARLLGVTQSALSQRVSNLERELGSSLFLRESAGIRLTELGEKCLRMCQLRTSIEEEFLLPLGNENRNEIAGIVKLGAFSTVMRSIIMPAFVDFTRQNSLVQWEFMTRELDDLPNLLFSGEADFILHTKPLENHGIENIRLGIEENVLVQGKNSKSPKNVFLDHDAKDSTTEDFFKIQTTKPNAYRKQYMDEVYSIIDGVHLGYGRSILPLHIIKGMRGLEIVPGFKSLKIPIYLSFHRQPYYTKLQIKVLEILREKIPLALQTT